MLLKLSGSQGPVGGFNPTGFTGTRCHSIVL